MKSAIIIFPASNCDRDAQRMILDITGSHADMVWHKDRCLDKYDLIVLPGGFAFGDYLRSGAIAANSPIIKALKEQIDKGVPLIGICNGFQILCEMRVLPGSLAKNKNQLFISKFQDLYLDPNWFVDNKASNNQTDKQQQEKLYYQFPIAHMEGRYWCDQDTLASLQDNKQILLRYVDNPNGSIANIAAISNKNKNIIGMMPHPERAMSSIVGSDDGKKFFEKLFSYLNLAD